MAMGSDRSANFVIKAKDAATGPLGKIGGAMGRLKSAAGTAFKVMAAAAITAATAIAGLAIASIKGAIDDEKAQARLIATLRARGLATEKNKKAIDDAIASGQKMAFTDDDVRSSIETATQFTDKFSKALKIQKVAQDLAIAKGIDLESATSIVGKAYAGNGKALKAYGIELQKTTSYSEKKIVKDKYGTQTERAVHKTRKETVKGMAALNLITEKFGGIAKEVSETTAVKLEAAQIALNEKFEEFGAKFLPAVNEGLTFFTNNVLPLVTPALDTLATFIGNVSNAFAGKGGIVESVGKVVGPIIDDLAPAFQSVADSLIGPDGLITSVGKLIGALWGNGDGALAGAFKALGGAIEVAFALAKPFFDALKWLVDNITTVLDAMNKIGAAKTVEKGAAAATAAGYSSSSFVNPMNAGNTSVTTNTNLYLDTSIIANATSNYLGNQTRSTNPQRSFPRNP